MTTSGFEALEHRHWKGTFINNIIGTTKNQPYEYQSYLELGIAGAHTWHQIACPYKTGVDTNPRVLEYTGESPGIIHTLTTDEFFAKKEAEQDSESYDVVFIDAFHERDQVRRDFFNSLKSLSSDGIIVLHDINPLHEDHTSPANAGDVYEFWMDLVDHANVHVFVGPQQDTVGLFFNWENPLVEEFESRRRGYGHFEANRRHYIEDLHLAWRPILECVWARHEVIK